MNNDGNNTECVLNPKFDPLSAFRTAYLLFKNVPYMSVCDAHRLEPYVK